MIAFNLDQQREIFRNDDFQTKDFYQLNAALQSLELGSVSYKTLGRETGWADLLVNLVDAESNGSDPADAVVFLGPNSRILDKVAPESVRSRADIGPRLYYFEYFFRVGYEFPDAIHQLTNACRGTVFKLHSPADFAASIAKLQRRLDSDSATPLMRTSKQRIVLSFLLCLLALCGYWLRFPGSCSACPSGCGRRCNLCGVVDCLPRHPPASTVILEGRI